MSDCENNKFEVESIMIKPDIQNMVFLDVTLGDYALVIHNVCVSMENGNFKISLPVNFCPSSLREFEAISFQTGRRFTDFREYIKTWLLEEDKKFIRDYLSRV